MNVENNSLCGSQDSVKTMKGAWELKQNGKTALLDTSDTGSISSLTSQKARGRSVSPSAWGQQEGQGQWLSHPKVKVALSSKLTHRGNETTWLLDLQGNCRTLYLFFFFQYPLTFIEIWTLYLDGLRRSFFYLPCVVEGRVRVWVHHLAHLSVLSTIHNRLPWL